MKQITIGLFIALILVPSVSFAQVPMTDVQKQQLIATLLAQVKVLQLKLAQLQAQPRVSAQVTRDAKAAELKAKKNARIAEEEVKWRAEEQKEKDDRLAQVSKWKRKLPASSNCGSFQ